MNQSQNLIKFFILIMVCVLFAILGLRKINASNTLSKEPTLEEISICFHTKSDLFAEAMKDCSEDDYQCMEDNFIKVCEFK